MSLRHALTLATTALATTAVLGCGALVTPSTAMAVAATTELPTSARVNARWVPVKDSQGNTWPARYGFTGNVRRSEALEGHPIDRTSEDVLYQASVFGMTGWSTPLATGTYRVRLMMAEHWFDKPGERVFDVHAEGQKVLSNVDIARDAGRRTAHDRTFDVAVHDGSLDLRFEASVNKALITAIEVVPAPAPAPAPTVPPTPPILQLPTEPTPPTAPALPTMVFGADSSGSGRAPVERGGVITSRVGGGDGRSEVFWGSEDGGRIRLARGTTVTAEFDVRHDLADPRTGAWPSTRTWHTLFQLHGPTKAGGTWPTPPFTIAWQNGTYRIGGGAAVPDARGDLQFRGSWYQPYIDSPGKRWERIKVEAYLDGPGRGWVSVWVDGRLHIDRWKPVAGTMYTDSGQHSHREINLKSGLYTGTDSPSWNRSTEHRNMRVTWSGPAGSGSAATR
ncbi:MAG: malectin domain-containing carbohydrate-binding protein [Mobilicoccus sp.]|nr:malectin domain-containing carbohydrate-binding protein [Mobilicoccus sp.]